MQRFFLVLILLVVFQACSARVPSLPNVKKFQVHSDKVDKEVFDKLLWNAGKTEALSASMNVEFSKYTYSEKFRASVAYEIPDKLRFEILPPALGPPQIILLSLSDKISLLNRADKRMYHGKSTAENISNLLGLPLDAFEIMRWLSGGIPLRRTSKIENLSYYTSKSGDLGLLEVILEGEREFSFLLEIDKQQKLTLKAFELKEGEKKVLHTRYTFDLEDEKKFELPTKIETWFVEKGLKLNIDIKNSKANPNWPYRVKKKLFRVKKPRSFELIDLESRRFEAVLGKPIQ